ncbi:hypothetical protein JKP88DRAFT_277481 [Tribonema minus]|uniref:Uncharacterized protein n=1 Tax=Tribonema minus TaxID=303371 RepID=A0A835Z2E1_9STRA|nr:hypothetical protein JKP88DRAFT_277481 [Tribonema minus]
MEQVLRDPQQRQQLLNSITRFTANFTGSPGYWHLRRLDLEANCYNYGGQVQRVEFRRQQVNSNPAIATWWYAERAQRWHDIFFGTRFLNAVWDWARTEYQSSGADHSHCITREGTGPEGGLTEMGAVAMEGHFAQLLTWGANVDWSALLSSRSAMEYAVKYASKGETSSEFMRRLLQALIRGARIDPDAAEGQRAQRGDDGQILAYVMSYSKWRLRVPHDPTSDLRNYLSNLAEAVEWDQNANWSQLRLNYTEGQLNDITTNIGDRAWLLQQRAHASIDIDSARPRPPLPAAQYAEQRNTINIAEFRQLYGHAIDEVSMMSPSMLGFVVSRLSQGRMGEDLRMRGPLALLMLFDTDQLPPVRAQGLWEYPTDPTGTAGMGHLAYNSPNAVIQLPGSHRHDDAALLAALHRLARCEQTEEDYQLFATRFTTTVSAADRARFDNEPHFFARHADAMRYNIDRLACLREQRHIPAPDAVLTVTVYMLHTSTPHGVWRGILQIVLPWSVRLQNASTC